MSDSLLTTFVTQLDELTSFSTSDYFLVSRLSSGGDYVSQKMSGTALSLAISSAVDSAVGNQFDELSDAISANYDAISALQTRQAKCEQAVVKIANCVYQAKNDIKDIASALSGQEAWGEQGANFAGETTLSVLRIGNTTLTEDQLSALLSLLSSN